MEALSNEECKVTNLVLDNQNYSFLDWRDLLSDDLLNNIKQVFCTKQKKAKLQQQEELERLQWQKEQNNILLQEKNNREVDNIIKNVEGNTKINLKDKQIGDYGAEKLADTLLLKEANTVKALYLSNNNITNEGMETLVPAIERHITSLQHLSLSRNHVCGTALTNLIKSLKTSNISFLSLNEVTGEYDGVYTAIADLIENTKTLTMLSLSGNNLGYMITPIIKALKYNKTVQGLDLSGNNLGYMIASIIEVLQINETVQCLNLSRNNIYDIQLLTQFKVLFNDNHTLTELSITASNARGRSDEFRDILNEINKLLDRNKQEVESKKMQHSEEIEQKQELEQPEEANAMQDENQKAVHEDESLLAAASNTNNLLEVTSLGENYSHPSDVVGD